MADRLATDYDVFDSRGVVKSDHWSGVVKILETFLSGYPNAFSVMQATARGTKTTWKYSATPIGQ